MHHVIHVCVYTHILFIYRFSYIEHPLTSIWYFLCVVMINLKQHYSATLGLGVPLEEALYKCLQ